MAQSAAWAASFQSEVAAQRRLHTAMVSLDLTKAFDKVLRELVFGWPCHIGADRECRLAYLVQCGVSEEVAGWICDFLDEHGTAFEQMNVDEKVTSLIRELHCKSWFVYPGC